MPRVSGALLLLLLRSALAADCPTSLTPSTPAGCTLIPLTPYTGPAGGSAISVSLAGAGGGSSKFVGGNGASFSVTFLNNGVTPFFVSPAATGGRGSNGGGGGGGGASALWSGTTVIAAAGGGGGASYVAAGGDAGSPGGIGTAGGSNPLYNPAGVTGGRGGTQNAGGAAGLNWGDSGGTPPGPGGAPSVTTGGAGGVGGRVGNNAAVPGGTGWASGGSGFVRNYYDAGGGGAGWYGGGGGAYGNVRWPCGGGGGSSYVNAAVPATSASYGSIPGGAGNGAVGSNGFITFTGVYQCAAGFYCTATGAPPATQCPAGSYCVTGTAGQSAALPCPVGFWCPAGSSTGTANPCALGTFCLLSTITPAACAPALVANAAFLLSTPGSWTWTCAANFYGTPVTRACSVTTGVFSGTPITCAACVAPLAPTSGGVSYSTVNTWSYTCNPGYISSNTLTQMTPYARVCNSVTGAFSGSALTCVPCGGNGTYCPGNTDGGRYPCPAGTWGAVGATMLASAVCSGACSAGYFCPAGSTTSTASACGGVGLYCPPGSGSPINVPDGFISTPSAGPVNTRTGISACAPGLGCAGGVVLPPVSFGTSCAAGLAIPITEGPPSGVFGPTFSITTPGFSGGFTVTLSAAGCPITASNVTWSNATQRLSIPSGGVLSFPPCQGGATMTLIAARTGFPLASANCTFSLNVTQVAQIPTISDCGPRVIMERLVQGTPTSFPPGAGSNATSVGLVATTSNVGTVILWSINTTVGAYAPALPFSIGPCDGIIRSLATLKYRTQSTYTFPIVARNDGSSIGIGFAIASCMATVTIIPAPLPPMLTTSAFTLLELSPPGTLMGNVGAYDMDGYPIISYRMVNGTGNVGGAPLFTTDARGNLTVTSVIQATLSGIFVYVGTLNVSTSYAWSLTVITLTLSAVPQPPATLPGQVRSVPELSSNGTLIGEPLVATSYSGFPLSFSLLAAPAAFNITSAGQLFVVNGAALVFATQSSYVISYLVSEVSPLGLYSSSTVTITITEVAKPPVWTTGVGGVFNFSVAEGSAGGTLLTGSSSVQAVSLSQRGLVTYSLNAVTPIGGFLSTSPAFVMSPITGALSVNPLFPLGTLLAGINTSYAAGAWTYALALSATDSAYGLSVNGTAYVTLTSIAPRASPTSVRILANASVGMPVISLAPLTWTAYSTSTLSYAIVAEPTVLGDASFVVNALSGIVSVANASYAGGLWGPPRWDPNTKTVYTVAYTVTDAVTSRTGSSIATVTLAQVNRAPSWLPLSVPFAVASAQTAPAVIGQPLSLSAFDPDVALGINETLTFTITGGNTDSTFALDPVSGQLTAVSSTSPSFIYSTTDWSGFLLIVTVTDAGVNGPRFSATTVLNITLMPYSAPPTVPSPLSFTVLEHSAIGTPVGFINGSTAVATAPLVYTLSPTGSNVNQPFPFSLNTFPVTGANGYSVLSVSGAPINFSPWMGAGNFRTYTMAVTVTDNRLGYPLMSQGAVTVTVLWVAEPPTFNTTVTPPEYAPNSWVMSGFIREQSLPGWNVSASACGCGTPAFFTALIKDPFLVPYLSYSIAASTPAASAAIFAVEPATGRVFVRPTAPAFTFSATPSFLLMLTATVVGAPAPWAAANGLRDTANLTIAVVEINNPASFIGAGNGLFSASRVPVLPYNNVTIPDSTSPGTIIGFVAATDPNAPSSLWGQRNYALAPTPAAAAFSVNPATGAISIAPGVSLNFNVQSVFALIATCTDSDPLANITVSFPFTVFLTQTFRVTITSISANVSEIAAGRAVNVADSPYASSFILHAVLISTSGSIILVNGTDLGVLFPITPAVVTVKYGSYVGSCRVTLPNTAMSCFLPPGVGSGYELAFIVDGQPSAYAPLGFLVGYLPPVITSVTRVSGALTAAGQSMPTTALGERLTVLGMQFGAVGSLLFLTYGQASAPTRYTTAACTVVAPNTEITCPAVAGVGAGLIFSIVAGGTASQPFNTSLVQYAPPTLSSVSAPLLFSSGGQTINVTGSNFGPPGTADVTLSYSDAPGNPNATLFTAFSCAVPASGAHTTLICTSAPGAGAGLGLIVSVGGQSITSLPRGSVSVSYLPPTVTGLSGPGTDLTVTTGGSVIYISGTQFGPLTPLDDSGNPAGPLQPLVTYGRPNGASGPLSFRALGCRVSTAFTVVTCTLTEGSGADLVWALSIGGQNSSYTTATTAYQAPVVAYFTGPGNRRALTQGGQAVTVVGTNFGPASAPIDRVSYGEGNVTFFATCVHNAESPHTQLDCLTAVGAGAGLTWQVVIDGQLSRQPMMDYSPPGILALSGPGASNADPAGGQVVIITGGNFSIPQFLGAVTYGPTGFEYVAQQCNVTVNHTEIQCLTSPGSGAGLRWLVTIDDQTSLLSKVTSSYTSPFISAVFPSIVPTYSNPSSPTLVTLAVFQLPLYSPQFTVFVKLGNPSSIYATPTAIFPAQVPQGAAIPAATNVDGSVNVSFTLPQAWAGAAQGVQLFVASTALAQVTTSYSSLAKIATSNVAILTFAAPFVANVIVTRAPWLSNPALASLCPSRNPLYCSNTSTLQISVLGSHFAGGAPDATPSLGYCAAVNPANCSSWTMTDESRTSSAFIIASWTESSIIAYTQSATGSVNVSIITDGISPDGTTPGPRLLQSSAMGFKDLSPSISAITGAESPFPCAGDPFYNSLPPLPVPFVVTVTVDQLMGATGARVTVGGVTATLCDASGTPVPDALVQAQIIASQGTGAYPLWQVSFLVPPGQGAGAPVQLTRLRGITSDLSNQDFTISYIPPAVSSIRVLSLRTGAVTDVSTLPLALNISTDASEVVQVQGTNLGTSPQFSIASAAGTLSTVLATPSPCWSTVTSLYTCWSVPAPAGEGGGFTLRLFAGNQAAAVLMTWSFSPPSIASVTPVFAPSPSLPPGFPTAGGVLVALTGVNFGATWALSSAVASPLAVTFGFQGSAPTWLAAAPSWTQACTGVTRVNSSYLTCTLPQGSGARLGVAVAVAGVLGVSPAVFSYGSPIVFSVSAALTTTPSLTSGWAFPILRGPTTGGTLLTIRGANFGAPNPAHCVFLTWAQRPIDTSLTPRLHVCDGFEGWLGEGEMPMSNIVSWSHTLIIFATQPGLGHKELQLSIAGATLHPPRTPSAPTTNATVPRFWYSDPQLFSMVANVPGATLPLIIPTNGGMQLVINGSNFGPPPLNTSVLTNVLTSDLFSPPLPLSLAPSLQLSFPIVVFNYSCAAFGLTIFGAPSLMSVVDGSGMPRTVGAGSVSGGSCTQTIISISHTQIILSSPIGVGVNKTATVKVVSASGEEQLASSDALYSYAPPVITSFDPSYVTLRSLSSAPPVAVSIRGNDFGISSPELIATWSPSERALSGLTGGVPCLSMVRTTADIALTGVSQTLLVCTVQPSLMVAGYSNATVFVAGQAGFQGPMPSVVRGAVVYPLLFVCDKGYYGHVNESCLPCPAQSSTPALVGAVCAGYTPYPGLSFEQSFSYPEPLPGFFNLNSSDCSTRAVTAGGDSASFVSSCLKGAAGTRLADFGGIDSNSMLRACPAGMRNDGRDSCIVACNPTSACLGNNICAVGYASVPPMWRCSSCAKGYYKQTGSTCIKCPDSSIGLIIGMACLLMLVAFGGFMLNKYQVNIAVLSIGVDFFQVLAIFAQSNVAWPPEVLQLMNVLSAFNLNINIVAPECLIPNVSYTDKFFFILGLPLAFAAIFVITFALIAFQKRCVRGITEKRKVYSHTPSLISSTLVLLYLLYLYLTRTALDTFNCQPTTPPDGVLYLQVAFVPCNVQGGLQQSLVFPSVVALLLYTCAYPLGLGYALWRNKELIMEDQLLRAKGVGNDRLSNPRALDLRHKLGRSYFQFRPERHAWIIIILGRKFLIALTAVLFNASVDFQMAACLLIMFGAYSAQVQNRPYMSPVDTDAVLLHHDVEALKGGIHSRLKAAIAGIETRGRKRTRKNLMTADGRVDRSAILAVVGNWLVNYNFLEEYMSFSAVLVCVSALLYQNSASTGIKGVSEGITQILLIVIVCAILFWFAALFSEIYSFVAEASAAKAAARGVRAKKGALSSSPRNSFRRSLSMDDSKMEAAVNPMFLSAGGDSANIGATQDSLVASILQQAEAPPTALWLVFRDEFVSLTGKLKEASATVAESKVAIQKLEGVVAATEATHAPIATPTSDRSRFAPKQAVLADVSLSPKSGGSSLGTSPGGGARGGTFALSAFRSSQVAAVAGGRGAGGGGTHSGAHGGGAALEAAATDPE